MTYKTITVELSGAVARLTLSRPEKRNCLSVIMHEELRAALAGISKEPARVLLITGAGSAFCAGQDLSERRRLPGQPPVDLGNSIEENYKPLCLALQALPIPVVAAVNGVAAGAGANIALACDLVIAKKSASFIQSFCKLGLLPDSGGTWTLPRLVGTARAMGLTLLGDRMSAEQAEAWGMIWRSVEDEVFESEVSSLVSQLAESPTLGLGRTKLAIYRSATANFEQSLDLERDSQRALGFPDDYAEGVAAFQAKRSPRFSGR